MSAVEMSEVTGILDRVKEWPVESRIVLARRILETVGPEGSPPPARRGRSVQDLIGLGAGDSPPPDDETVRRWIEERWSEKYG
jgi:hypothetical protein